MNIDPLVIAYIKNAINTAKLVGIENLIVENKKVRGSNEQRTAILLQENNVPDLPFKSIGLSRIDFFLSRLELVQPLKDFEATFTLSDDKEFVRSVDMKAKGVSVSYRCANPSTIQAPKVFKDNIKYKLDMTPEALLLISKGVGAMGGAEDIILKTNKNKIEVVIEDITKDSLTFDLDTRPEIIDGDSLEEFTYKFPIKMILPLFRQNSGGQFYITTKGILKINVNGLDFYIPRKD
jgi:hypothetical protein